MIWSSTSTLALSIGTFQRNAAQITDESLYLHAICILHYLKTFKILKLKNFIRFQNLLLKIFITIK